nr:MAG TPA: hypothetical protein [Caudoviricetes sp.]
MFSILEIATWPRPGHNRGGVTLGFSFFVSVLPAGRRGGLY